MADQRRSSGLTLEIPTSPAPTGKASSPLPLMRAAQQVVKKADVDKAMNAVNKAVELLMDLKQLSKVVVMLTEAIQIKPKRVQWLTARAFAYRAMGLYAHAILDANSIVFLEPRVATGYVLRSLALIRMGRFEAAVQDLNIAIDLDPRNPAFQYYKGVALMELGDVEAAIMQFTSAAEACNDRLAFKAKVYRATCKERVGLIAEAIAELSSLARLEGHSPEVHYRLAKLLYRQGHYCAARDAIDIAASACSSSPFPPARIFTLKAEIALAMGNIKQALKDSHIAVACLPSGYALPVCISESDMENPDFSAPAVTRRLTKPTATEGTMVTLDTAPAYLVRGLSKLACGCHALAMYDITYARIVGDAVADKARQKDGLRSKISRDIGAALGKPSRELMRSRKSPTRSPTSPTKSPIDHSSVEAMSAAVDQQALQATNLSPELSSALGDELPRKFVGSLLSQLRGGGPNNLLYDASKLAEVSVSDGWNPDAWTIPTSVVHDDEEAIQDVEEEMKMVLGVTDGRIGRGRRRDSASCAAVSDVASPTANASNPIDDLQGTYQSAEFDLVASAEALAPLLCRRAWKYMVYRAIAGLLPALDYARSLPFFGIATRSRSVTPKVTLRSPQPSTLSVRDDKDVIKVCISPPKATFCLALETNVPWPPFPPTVKTPVTRDLAMLLSRITCAQAVVYLAFNCVQRAALHVQHALILWPLNVEAHMVAAQVQFTQRDFESAMISLNCVNTLASENGVLSKICYATGFSPEIRTIISDSGITKEAAPVVLDRSIARSRSSSLAQRDDVFGEVHSQKRLSSALWRDVDIVDSITQPGITSTFSVSTYHTHGQIILDPTSTVEILKVRPQRRAMESLQDLFAIAECPPSLQEMYTHIATSDAVNLKTRPRSEWASIAKDFACVPAATSIARSFVECYKGATLYAMQQYHQAKATYTEAISSYDNFSARVHRAMMHLICRDGAAAVADCLSALEKDNTSALAWYYLGKSYCSVGDFKHAAEAFKESFQRSNHPEPLVARAASLGKLTYYAEALADIDTALATSSNDYRLWEEKAAVKASQRNAAAAVADFEKALSCEPCPVDARARIYYEMGVVYANDDKYDAAIAQFDRCLQELAGIQDHSTAFMQCQAAVDDLIAFAKRAAHTGATVDPVVRQREIMKASTAALADITALSKELNYGMETAELAQLRYQAIFERAKALQMVHRTLEATHAFTFIISQKTIHPHAIFRRAFCFKELKLYDLAANDFETAKEQSDDPVFRVNYNGLADINVVVTSPAGTDPVEPICGMDAMSEFDIVVPVLDTLRMLVQHSLDEEERRRKEEEGGF